MTSAFQHSSCFLLCDYRSCYEGSFGFVFYMAANVWPVPFYFKESGMEQKKLFLCVCACARTHAHISVCAYAWGDSKITVTETHKTLNKKFVT
jgi:hypothetical protein